MSSFNINQAVAEMPCNPQIIKEVDEKGNVSWRVDPDYQRRLWEHIQAGKQTEQQAKIDAQKAEQAKRKAIWLAKQGK